MNVRDEGNDIDSYLDVSQLLENKYLCFFNSLSAILDDIASLMIVALTLPTSRELFRKVPVR